MLPVEQHLRRLMLDYDCVTIPGLGGFVMQSRPASINPGKNRIFPPTRDISFNSLLNHDDGLLVSAIARERGIPYRDASQIVTDLARNWTKSLNSGLRISIGGFGELSKGPENRIHFKQVGNEGFATESYGMVAINVYPLQKTQPESRLSKKPVDRKARQAKVKSPTSVKWTVAVSLPIILFLLYGIFFPQSMQNIYTQYTGVWYNAQPVQEKNIIPEQLSPPITLTEPASGPEPEILAEKAVPEVISGPKYYVIGGCFAKEENAEKFLSGLLSQGYNAEKAGATPSGHARISYKSFAEKSAALEYLKSIKEEVNPSAWLLKY